MRKLSFAILAASIAIALAGCIATTDVQPAPTSEVPVEMPEWLHGSFDEGYADHVLISAGIEAVGENLIYSARADDGYWCVIVAVPPAQDGDGDDGIGSAACGPPANFEKDGAKVTYSGGGHSGGAHLLPPGFNKPLEPGWVRVSPQLAIRD